MSLFESLKTSDLCSDSGALEGLFTMHHNLQLYIHKHILSGCGGLVVAQQNQGLSSVGCRPRLSLIRSGALSTPQAEPRSFRHMSSTRWLPDQIRRILSAQGNKRRTRHHRLFCLATIRQPIISKTLSHVCCLHCSFFPDRNTCIFPVLYF